MSEKSLRVPIRGRDLELFVSHPASGPTRAPAVIVIHEIFGADAHIRDVAERFSREGYIAVAPNLFTGELERVLTPPNIALAMQSFATAPPDLRRNPAKLAEFAATQPPERRPILEAFGRISSPEALAGFGEDLAEVARHVRHESGVDPGRTGAVGFCFGGGMAGRLATLDPDLRAAVIFYGQNPPLADVPKIRAKILGLYGSEDRGITDTVPELAAAMQEHGKSFEYHVYAGAKHAFFNDTRPTNYNAEAARDAWTRVLRFFATDLRGEGAASH